MKQAVSNTGPIIALAKIGHLVLMDQIFSSVFIPPIVYRELLGKFGNEWSEIENALNTFIKVAELPSLDETTEIALSSLDEGEKQAVGLASTLKDKALLIIDDRAGRETAKKLNIEITGTIGILLIAKEKGLVDDIKPLIEQLRDAGYWLSDEILEIVKRLEDQDLKSSK